MSCGLPVPGAAEPFTIRTASRAEVPVWFHVYSTATHPTKADTFSQGWGDTRFAPLRQANGDAVHTYYVSSTIEAALMESVLHDVVLSPPGMFELAALNHHFLVELSLPDPIRFASFHTPYLPPLQLTRAQIVDALPTCYPETRAWSQAAYLQCPAAQAVGYGSRRDDAARCLMLFGQRLPTPPFTVLSDRCLGTTPAMRDQALALVRSLRLHEI